jgi:uncharacterized protein
MSALLTLGATLSAPAQPVGVPLGTLNRHGLVSGATGTGKTKTIQRLAEQCSLAGVPVLLMDVKGDLSGLAEPGEASEVVQQRAADCGVSWQPQAFPVELCSLSETVPGVRLRATVTEMGPRLLGQLLKLNDTQQSVLSVLMHFADEAQLPLVDLQDLRDLLQYVSTDGEAEYVKRYGALSSATVAVLQRTLIDLEASGAAAFFGEPSFEVADLLRRTPDGRGVLSVLRVPDLLQRPQLFTTFMLSLVTELFQTLPEVGDLPQPKLVVVIDEAHLLFADGTAAVHDDITTLVKLIRSKGVGIVFCTQLPTDIPHEVLSQLGLKVQHALRAFTPADREALDAAVRTFPITPGLDVAQAILSLGIGEALVTALDERGVPSPLQQTRIAPPQSRMDVLLPAEAEQLVAASFLRPKYEQSIDRESAHERLQQKLGAAAHVVPPASAAAPTPSAPASSSPVDTLIDGLGVFTGSPLARSLAKSMATSLVRNLTGQLTRGLFGVLKR